VDYASRIDKCDELIVVARETLKKAELVGARWLVQASEKEIIWATSERSKLFKKMMERNGR